MSSDTKPDDATVDSVTNAELITRVHTFLCALLTFLGFKVLPVETIVDMLDTLETWLVDAKTIRRDTQGATARIWWDAFKAAWDGGRKQTEFAERMANEATGVFGRYFLPVAEEDRDTLNTADFDAMRTELDQADRYRSEICNALDGVEGNRAFVHGKVIDELRAERDALLKANAHHASEVEQLRRNGSEYLSLVCQALGVDRGADTIATITAMRNERGRIIIENATLANALNGVRAEILAPSLPDDEVAGVIRQIVGERDALHIATCDALGWPAGARFDRFAALKSLRQECDKFKSEAELVRDNIDSICTRHSLTGMDYVNKTFVIGNKLDELKTQLAGAIVPLPKPEHVEVGQRWAHVDVVFVIEDRWVFTVNGGEYNTENMHNSDWLVYLGTDKV
jgi:hypothetical protein